MPPGRSIYFSRGPLAPLGRSLAGPQSPRAARGCFSGEHIMRLGRKILVLGLAVLAFSATSPLRLAAQGVTTGGIGGIVTGAQQQPIAGASVIAIHEPSGTSYEATTRADGRYSIPAMRVGGPYTVQVVYVGGGAAAFAPKTVENINISLGVISDVDVSVEAITVAEQIEVTGVSDPVFASTRTGASTEKCYVRAATGV